MKSIVLSLFVLALTSTAFSAEQTGTSQNLGNKLVLIKGAQITGGTEAKIGYNVYHRLSSWGGSTEPKLQAVDFNMATHVEALSAALRKAKSGSRVVADVVGFLDDGLDDGHEGGDTSSLSSLPVFRILSIDQSSIRIIQIPAAQ